MSTDSPHPPGYDELDDRSSLWLDRREFLGFLGATVAASACGDLGGNASPSRVYPNVRTDRDVPSTPPPEAPDLPGNPFELGVACGDPHPRGFVLWTRLAPRPLDGGGMPDERVPVVWEIAEDPQFRSVVGSNWLYATADLAHSVHVDIRGLRPNSEYWYRFRIGDRYESPRGRARTFPAPNARPKRLRMATASCQNWVDGYYTAHKHLAQEDLDLVAFLGDYIYEYGYGGEESVRRHRGPTLETLEQFRQRYALYKSDPNLQAAHQNCPWLMTWDDHEVSNNYAGMEPGKGGIEDFKKMRAAAYQAYFEHMPLRIPLPDDTSSMQIYRSFRYGDLIRLNVLDGRQYRSGIVCGGDVDVPCDEAFAEDETMLGDEQRDWLVDRLRGSETIWNAICQQTVFTPVNLDNSVVNPDMWDGYQAERQDLLEVFGSEEVDNVTVLTGDIHSAGLAELPARDDNPQDARTVGHEIVTTSITSGNSQLGGSGDITELLRRRLDYIRYFNPALRGYCVLEYTRDRCRFWYRTVSTVRKSEADLDSDRIFEIEAGSGKLRELTDE